MKSRKELLYLMLFSSILDASDLIVINKKNVVYKFVPFDETTDRWIRNVFPHWEPETFDVFNIVKDSKGIAIDLGAWIGTTAIWLAKNFSHVLAVDADKVSLQCLRNNLGASECFNVTICENAIFDKNTEVIFGPAGGQKLNDSMSLIKDQSDNHSEDYIVRTITFKELLDTYIYQNENLRSKKISFIKCDIEGGEENIIPDLLNFAYHNNVKVYLSFHLTWWRSKKITDFSDLFALFKTNSPHDDICEYVKQNPFTSILFDPTR